MKLVFIGDSLTEWFDWRKRFPEHDVLNLGISGETVEGLMMRRSRIREASGEPDVVFLMTGINNILMEQYDFERAYAEIVRNFKTWWKGSDVVVQSLLPVDMPWIKNDFICDVNNRLKKLALEAGADYLDVYSTFTDDSGSVRPGYLTDDGVHVSNAGYEAWAQVVSGFLGKR